MHVSVGVGLLLVLWLSISAVVVCGMWAFPAAHFRRPPLHQQCCFFRLISGEMPVSRVVLTALMGAGVLWWLGAAGLLVSDALRGGLVLSGGVVIAVSLFNAGRRADLSAWGHVCLGGFLGAYLIVLMLLTVELLAHLLGDCPIWP